MMCLKKIHSGSFFPDQQLYTTISVSTKRAVGSFMNNDQHRQKLAACMINGKLTAERQPIYLCPYRGHASSFSSMCCFWSL